VGAEQFYADGRTGTSEAKVALRNSANPPIKCLCERENAISLFC